MSSHVNLLIWFLNLRSTVHGHNHLPKVNDLIKLRLARIVSFKLILVLKELIKSEIILKFSFFIFIFSFSLDRRGHV